MTNTYTATPDRQVLVAEAEPTKPETDNTAPSPWAKVAATVALLTVIVCVLLTAFTWPSVNSSVHDVPIAVAGPAAAVDQLSATLNQRMPGAFDITQVDSTAAAEQLIRDRAVYGAIDLSTGTPQIITASAGSAAAAQTLQGVGTTLAQAQEISPTVAVRDIVALPTHDPRGVGLAAGALPLVMAGLLAAVLLTNLVRGTARRVVGALTFAATAGLALTAILQYWFGSLDGSYLANAAAVALTIAAISMTLLGLAALLGSRGIGVGAAIMMLIGNPLSGAATAPAMLPGWSGALGQELPPGAGGQLLRSTAFFDGHGATHSLIVLLVWLGIGVALCRASDLHRRRTTTAATTDTAPQPPVHATP